jgi:hypothetical protein
MNKKIFTLFFPAFYQNIPPVIRTTIPMIDNSGLAYSIIVPRAVSDFPLPSKNFTAFSSDTVFTIWLLLFITGNIIYSIKIMVICNSNEISVRDAVIRRQTFCLYLNDHTLRDFRFGRILKNKS